MIVGQSKLLNTIDKIIDRYPKFSILTGPKGSGKKTILKQICNRLNVSMVNFGTGIDEVRQIIDLAYDQVKPICYVCADADNMSLGAKNSLLKITEEPPQNAYFILTLQSIGNTLETIQSRGTVLSLDAYTKDELLIYRRNRGYNSEFDYIVSDICTTTGEVDELFKNDVNAFYNFANTVTFQIHLPKTGNIFKISKSVKSKDNVNGYDAVLLFKAVRNLYIKKAVETHKLAYLHAANVTGQCLQELSVPTLNVVATIDNWIMAVRAVLREV